MFLISPIKTLYSINFYLQTLKESLWKAFGFLAYIFVLGAIFIALYAPVKLTPILNDGLEKIADITPNITVNNGIISANNNQKLIITPKELPGYKIIFNTGSTEPAYQTQMEKENILLYVNKNTVYAFANGQFQKNTFPKDLNLEISKDILLEKKEQIVKTLAYILVIMFILAFAFRMAMFTVFALIVALIISAVVKANLDFKKLLTLAFYVQGPIFIFDLILLVLPVHIIGMSGFIALIIFVIYLNLIFLRLRSAVVETKNSLDEDED